MAMSDVGVMVATVTLLEKVREWRRNSLPLLPLREERRGVRGVVGVPSGLDTRRGVVGEEPLLDLRDDDAMLSLREVDAMLSLRDDVRLSLLLEGSCFSYP